MLRTSVVDPNILVDCASVVVCCSVDDAAMVLISYILDVTASVVDASIVED